MFVCVPFAFLLRSNGTSRWLRYGLFSSLSDNDPGGDAAEGSDILQTANRNLSPNGGGEPTGELAEAIDRDFGSFEKFKAHFSAAAHGLQGSGWAVLGYDHIAGRLLVEQLTDQQGNTSVNFTPLLMLDMWEHAFYMQYKNVKPDYVKAVWNVFNRDDVAERFAAAKK
ncbi:superoxide dismutase [Corynebacterium accolens]|uniref:superoxide dismutase n=1 Tax=Corynebacterium accolens TaxID=38284 RepID=UPI0025435D00|nr:superoxide dismutase [Corynebacterium accolens]MDK4268435.1 superoxide dismutase [Corynebacterium accolens]